MEEFEGLEKMFMELLKMCEQFDARVRMLEDQLVQVKETRDTFLKEISAKHEDFIRKLADSQEALIKEAVDRKISSLENEGKRCNLGKSSPGKSSPSKSSPSKSSLNIESTVAAESLASEHLVEGVGGGSPKVKSLTDKANSSRLSPSAPEFVLPSMNSIPSGQPKNAPSYAMPTIPGYQVYQDPKLIFQQSGRSQNPNIQHPSFEPPSIQSLRLQHPPGWYIGNPDMTPPVIVPSVSSPGLPRGPMLMQAYLNK